MNSTIPARQGLDYVHRTIRAAILDGQLEPGTTMSQVMLADELGVSRTPLRVIDIIDPQYDAVSLKRVLADISAAVGEKLDIRPAPRSRPARRSARSTR